MHLRSKTALWATAFPALSASSPAAADDTPSDGGYWWPTSPTWSGSHDDSLTIVCMAEADDVAVCVDTADDPMVAFVPSEGDLPGLETLWVRFDSVADFNAFLAQEFDDDLGLWGESVASLMEEAFLGAPPASGAGARTASSTASNPVGLFWRMLKRGFKKVGERLRRPRNRRPEPPPSTSTPYVPKLPDIARLKGDLPLDKTVSLKPLKNDMGEVIGYWESIEGKFYPSAETAAPGCCGWASRRRRPSGADAIGPAGARGGPDLPAAPAAATRSGGCRGPRGGCRSTR